VDCPANIAIPQYFALYNKDIREGRGSAAEEYAAEKAKGGAIADCMDCGQCENMCPQHLEIRELFKTVKARFE
jgi:predicted aldo/keto reductase-like oxidoreductase